MWRLACSVLCASVCAPAGGLCGLQRVLLVHCRPGVSPLCIPALQELCRLFDLRKSCKCVSSDGAYKVFSPCQFNRQAHGTGTSRHHGTHGLFHRLILTDSVSTAGPHLHLHYLLSLVDGAQSLKCCTKCSFHID